MVKRRSRETRLEITDCKKINGRMPSAHGFGPCGRMSVAARPLQLGSLQSRLEFAGQPVYLWVYAARDVPVHSDSIRPGTQKERRGVSELIYTESGTFSSCLRTSVSNKGLFFFEGRRPVRSLLVLRQAFPGLHQTPMGMSPISF